MLRHLYIRRGILVEKLEIVTIELGRVRATGKLLTEELKVLYKEKLGTKGLTVLGAEMGGTGVYPEIELELEEEETEEGGVILYPERIVLIEMYKTETGEFEFKKEGIELAYEPGKVEIPKEIYERYGYEYE